MDVYIHSEIGVCNEYIAEGERKKESISIVISPLKVQSDEATMSLRVINGCNMWQSCWNAKCFFSKSARTNPKIKAQM